MNWQPIETAPKDTMKTVLLHTPEGEQLGWWCERLERHLTCEGKELWSDPTHWMPLPEPPKGGDDE